MNARLMAVSLFLAERCVTVRGILVHRNNLHIPVCYLASINHCLLFLFQPKSNNLFWYCSHKSFRPKISHFQFRVIKARGYFGVQVFVCCHENSHQHIDCLTFTKTQTACCRCKVPMKHLSECATIFELY